MPFLEGVNYETKDEQQKGFMTEQAKETWGAGEPYEQYVGRWSRLVAREFVAGLGVPAGRTWGDIGCGTGAVTETILAANAPQLVRGVDRSQGFVSSAIRRLQDPRVELGVGDGISLPWTGACCDAAVAGLVLNFVPDAAAMVREMARVTRPGGRVAAYVWDYSGGMEMMRHFWDAAIQVSPRDRALDQAERFPLCQPGPLEDLFRESGLTAVAVHAIVVPTIFRDFDDYWTPFLGGQGAAPTYLKGLEEETRGRIRALLQARLRPHMDGSIPLSARAWAVQGTV